MSEISERILGSLSRIVSLQLWHLGAIRVNLDEPFKLASGNYSPLYVDCRGLISSPVFVDIFSAAAKSICAARDIRVEMVAGGETAGIPFAAFLARSFQCPMVYVRKQIKAHGTASRIEGKLENGAQVLLVEDLITDAGSKLSFISALRDEGAIVRNVLVVFDRLQGGRETLERHSVSLYSLSDINVALDVAAELSLVTDAQRSELDDYLASPSDWHVHRNLPFTG
jgi:orotate phosphoribosyltransferase